MPPSHHHHAYFHHTRHLYQCKACGYQVSLTPGTIFHQNTLEEMVLDDLSDGKAKEWHRGLCC